MRPLRPIGPIAMGTFGALLVACTATIKLGAATYASDIRTICDAEHESGLALDLDAGGVSRWTRDHLSTAQGGRLMSSLRDLPIQERARVLSSQARSAGVRFCPMADAFALAAEHASARREIQRLCSTSTFPGLAELDDSLRVQSVAEWITKQAPGSAVTGLDQPLRSASGTTARAALMRQWADELDLYSCDVARTLSTPAVVACLP